MERQVDLKEISDGKLYTSMDMAKLGCGECAGCFACCCGMGDSILLDPLDCLRLEQALQLDFHGLIEKGIIELGMADGMIVPHMKMQETTNACPLLNTEGRCSIHKDRPGFCRLFPLGRYYHDETFSYILQVNECKKKTRSKVKIQKWLDIPKLEQYEAFVTAWHFFLKRAAQAAGTKTEADAKKLIMSILQVFYIKGFQKEETFYEEALLRLKRAEMLLR